MMKISQRHMTQLLRMFMVHQSCFHHALINWYDI